MTPKQGTGKRIIIASKKDCEEAGIMRCNCCLNYSHLACSRTTMRPMYDYTCIDCLLLNKLPTYFANQQIQHYLNMHEIIQRQALLLSLCRLILSTMLPDKAEQADFLLRQFVI